MTKKEDEMRFGKGSFVPCLDLGGKKINVYDGEVRISKKEIEKIVAFCKPLWEEIVKKTENFNFKGIIRFDLVPSFSSFVKNNGFVDFGEISFCGIYEINAHSPECCSALCAMNKKGIMVIPIWERIAKEIKMHFGKRILFIKGESLLKREWGDDFIDLLKKEGLELEVLRHPYNCLENANNLPIWRWGDVRFSETEDEFPIEVQNWILRQQKEKVPVFNTVSFLPEKDAGRKDILSSDLFAGPLSDFNGEKEDFVIKPLRGSSGKGIVFGRLADDQVWQKAINGVREGKNGLYKGMWLPRLPLNGKEAALDFNVAFWANGPDLSYLYSIIRMDDWDSYWKRGVINVCQGGGVASVLEE
ncbi:MAG: hypothetical protein WCR84_02390 [Candidatus Paceibacterota bacterium]|nr:hypothetical protein [Candidatus Paceibacterota bacterium]